MQLEISDDGNSVTAVAIFEDKATKKARRYRASVSIDDKHKSADRRKRLFTHYDASADGDVVRRQPSSCQQALLQDDVFWNCSASKRQIGTNKESS